MRPYRPRLMIMSLMIMVVIASLVLTGIFVRRERNRRIAALQAASAEYKNAQLIRELAEKVVAEVTAAIDKQDEKTESERGLMVQLVQNVKGQVITFRTAELEKKAVYEQSKAIVVRQLW